MMMIDDEREGRVGSKHFHTRHGKKGRVSEWGGVRRDRLPWSNSVIVLVTPVVCASLSCPRECRTTVARTSDGRVVVRVSETP